MNIEQRIISKKQGITNLFFTLFLVICTLLLAGCQDYLDVNKTGSNIGEGTLSLIIGGQNDGRTILPATGFNDFVKFDLDFIAKDSGNANFKETWTNGSGTIVLNVGTWDLHITAYLDGGGEGYLEAANGNLEDIEISSGNTVAGNIKLFPVNTGQGTFSWNINYPENITSANMEITRIDEDINPYNETFYFTGSETLTGKNGNLQLDAGQYRVIFRLSNSDEDMALSVILHIYQNMESTFSQIFTDAHFPSALFELPTPGLAYELINNGRAYSVSRGTATASEVVIPSTYNGLPVMFIGNEAFRDCSNLTSIVIPDSVTIIGDHAFSACRSLTSVTIGNSVTRIGGSAFWGCHSLTSIVIPNSVTIIGDRVFEGCSSLTSIVIPDSVTRIGARAFEGCSSLTSIVIPNSVTRIGTRAFWGCHSLTSIVIPSSVTRINDQAFLALRELTTVYYGGANYLAWSTIAIQHNNNSLINATRYYYSEIRIPNTHWRFVDGVPTVWE